MQLVVESEVVELVLGSLLLLKILQVWWAAAGELLVLQKPQILLNLLPQVPKVHHHLEEPQVLADNPRHQILHMKNEVIGGSSWDALILPTAH